MQHVCLYTGFIISFLSCLRLKGFPAENPNAFSEHIVQRFVAPLMYHCECVCVCVFFACFFRLSFIMTITGNSCLFFLSHPVSDENNGF